jgi:hypothetical protein
VATFSIRSGGAGDAAYERQGFERTGTFDVGGWIGQVFAMRL